MAHEYERKLAAPVETQQQREARLFGDPVLRSWITRGGRGLDAQVRDAYRWLRDRAGDRLPVEFEFRVTDLGQCFCKSSASTPHEWLDKLASEGLLERVDGHSGPNGFARVRLFDAHDVAELRIQRPDPQKQMGFVEQPDTIPFEDGSDQPGPLTAVEATDINRCSTHCTEQTGLRDSECARRSDGCTEQTFHVAADADAPPALTKALVDRLASGRYETWLGLSRWQIDLTANASTLFLPEYLRALGLPRDVVADVRAAVADCGLPPLVIEFASEITRRSENYTEQTAQQQDLVRSSSRASNQPTNQATKDLDQPETPALLAQAEALYARIGDGSLWKWVAIATVLLVGDGRLRQADVDRLVDEARFDFGAAVKQLAGQHWPRMGRLKSRLAELGIKWRRAWERGSCSRGARVLRQEGPGGGP